MKLARNDTQVSFMKLCQVLVILRLMFMGKYHHWLCACTFNYSLLMKSKKAIPVFIQTEMCITLDVREGWFIPGAHFASLADFVIHREVVEFILLDILGYTYISLLVWLLRLQICLLFKRGAATCTLLPFACTCQR